MLDTSRPCRSVTLRRNMQTQSFAVPSRIFSSIRWLRVEPYTQRLPDTHSFKILDEARSSLLPVQCHHTCGCSQTRKLARSGSRLQTCRGGEATIRQSIRGSSRLADVTAVLSTLTLSQIGICSKAASSSWPMPSSSPAPEELLSVHCTSWVSRSLLPFLAGHDCACHILQGFVHARHACRLAFMMPYLVGGNWYMQMTAGSKERCTSLKVRSRARPGSRLFRQAKRRVAPSSRAFRRMPWGPSLTPTVQSCESFAAVNTGRSMTCLPAHIAFPIRKHAYQHPRLPAVLFYWLPSMPANLRQPLLTSK